MKIKLYCIGTIKEGYFSGAVIEYYKRIGKFSNLQIIELPEERLPANASAKDEAIVINKESEKILAKLSKDEYVIAMDIHGKQISSEELAKKIEGITVSGKSTISFIIGGSLGLSESVKRRADFTLSFSKMTFPHQLFRVILLEQIYRAFKINKNEPYHK